jgi:hypothetical protein
MSQWKILSVRAGAGFQQQTREEEKPTLWAAAQAGASLAEPREECFSCMARCILGSRWGALDPKLGHPAQCFDLQLTAVSPSPVRGKMVVASDICSAWAGPQCSLSPSWLLTLPFD